MLRMVLTALGGIGLLALTQPASARTFCCEDSKGRMTCDDGVPAICAGRAYRELDNNGNTVRFYAAPLTAEQKAKADAELAKKKEEDLKQAEEDRKNRTLLGTYSTIQEIDMARERVLADLDKTLDQAKKKLAEAEKQKKQLANEAEFYKGHTMPDTLKAKIRDNDTDVAAQKKGIAEREQDMDAARARYDDDKKRFMALTGKTDNSVANSKPTK